MSTVLIPAEFEQFAADAVASGRYRDPAELVRAGLALLQAAERELAEFVVSLEQAGQDGEREGFLTQEQVEHRVQTAIAQIADRRDRADRSQ